MSAETTGARKIRKKTREQVYDWIKDPDLEDIQALKVLRNELPWKDWLLTDFLRYWYWLGVLAVVTFLVLELARRFHVDDVLGAVVLVVLSVAILAGAYLVYGKIWIEGPFTRAEDLRKAPRKLVKRRRFT